MPLYEFECRGCGKHQTKIVPVAEYEEPQCECGGTTDQVYYGAPPFVHTWIPGKWTGMYDLDYGKHATWDLTPPGKQEALKKAGVMRDHFEQR